MPPVEDAESKIIRWAHQDTFDSEEALLVFKLETWE